MLGGFISSFAAVEQKVIKKLKLENATSENKAIKLPNLNPLMQWRLGQLKKTGIIKETETGNFYFNEDTFRKVRKRRLIIIIPGIILSVVLIIIIHKYFLS